MSQITLRGLDPKTERELRRIAKKTGKSLNRVLLEIIDKSTDSKKKPPSESLRKLAGRWTETEASEFSDSIKICEQIDEVMWR
jgi:hypothetical protein